jgi:hypothetical protein
LKNLYSITMKTHEYGSNVRHLPEFMVTAHTPQEAAIIVRAIIDPSVKIEGKIYGFDNCDEFMDFKG